MTKRTGVKYNRTKISDDKRLSITDVRYIYIQLNNCSLSDRTE